MKFLAFGFGALLGALIFFIGFLVLGHFWESVHDNIFLNMNWIEGIISILIVVAMLSAAIASGENAEGWWHLAGFINCLLFILTLSQGILSGNHYLLVAILLASGTITSVKTSIMIEEKVEKGIMPGLFFIAMIGTIIVMAIF